MLIPYLSHCFLCLVFFLEGEALKGRERKLINLYLKFYELAWSLFNLKAGFCILHPALDDDPVQN